MINRGETLKISFEFFPPRTPIGMQKLPLMAAEFAEISPEYFSVTFGASGSLCQGTVETVELLQQATAVPIVPHLGCARLTRDQIVQFITHYKKIGVTKILALRGDRPVTAPDQSCEFSSASELVKLLQETAGNTFHIAVAAYPECHPEAQGMHENVLSLKKKFAAGAHSAITQYFFNTDAYFYFVDACAREGIVEPIVPGIMPIMQFERLVQFSAKCGAEIPRWLLKKLASFGEDQAGLQQFGVEFVSQLCERLVAGGAPGLHFYTLNQVQPSLEICQILSRPVVDTISKFEKM